MTKLYPRYPFDPCFSWFEFAGSASITWSAQSSTWREHGRRYICEGLIERSRPSTSSAAVQTRGSDPDNCEDETGRSAPPTRRAAGAHTRLRTAAATRWRQVLRPAEATPTPISTRSRFARSPRRPLPSISKIPSWVLSAASLRPDFLIQISP